MGISIDNGKLEERRPFIGFILGSALLIASFILLAPKLPSEMKTVGVFLFALPWSDVLRKRLVATGFPHSRWIIVLWESLVFLACAFLLQAFPIGKFLAPGLFVALHIPLAILKAGGRVARVRGIKSEHHH
jgi:hypothetical protein